MVLPRSMAVLLCIVMFGSQGVFAQTDTLAIRNGGGAPGTKGHRVPIVLSNTVALAGLQFTITQSPNAVMIDSVATTRRTAGFTAKWNPSSGKVLMVDFSGRRLIQPGKGPVAELICRVRPDAAMGGVTLGLSGVVLADSLAKGVPVGTVSSIFTVKQKVQPSNMSGKKPVLNGKTPIRGK